MTDKNKRDKNKFHELSLDELLAKITPKNRHKEYFAEPMGNELL